GVVGIGYWKGAVCDASLAGITRAIRYAIQIAGIDHVGLGSDFDGSITAPFDSADLAQLTASLLASGLSKAEVGKLLGGNLRRVLKRNLPD
ncbi:MAG: peptidase M19, partial [Gammaproteobacteria bacterium]|nr:peptidase M19 [Gammaproteobacteria bacterium]